MAQRKVNCEVYTDRGIVGKNGAVGKSAYQQAVEGGYQGTEEEFEQALASDIATVADNVTNINAVGNNIENVNTAVDNMSAIIAAPTAATQAAASASQAATSATNAQTSETNADTSASNAAASATNASASATIATTKASEATSSATSASASANSASESATIATTQAELAKEYADSIDLSNYRTSADQDIIDATKQDTITDLATIRSGASAGATAVQPDDLATVATSGSYADLTNKPTIPTVNNGTLTIQKNGTNVATFTANQSTASTANIEVPTKLSELTDDLGSSPVHTHSQYSTVANTVSNVVAGSTADKINVTKNGSTSTITINNVENATNATKATQDGDGNTISTTYAKKSTLATVATSGMYSDLTGTPGVATADTLGLVKPDGTTITVTENGTISATGGSGSGSGFDFEGTKAEFDAAVAAGTITADSVSLITDDVSGANVATKAELQAVDSSKADTSLSNTTPSQSFKEMSVGWGMPDYSALISITSPYTVPKNGIVVVCATSATTYFPVLRINNVRIFIPNSWGLGWALASKDDVASVENENNVANFYYIPFKG